MSILLDALKKSEEQRQLGQTPTIHTSIEGQHGERESAQYWIPLSLMALSLVVMTWFAWQQFRQPGPGNVQSAPPGPAESLTVQAIPPGQTVNGAPEQETAGQGTREPEQRTPVETYESQDRVMSDANARQAQLASESGKPEMNVSSTEEPSSPSVSANADSQTQMDQNFQEQQTRPAPMQPYIAEPVSYWELPQGVRDNLPDFKITVLVYAEKPGDRFLLLNGQRMAEKDELQSDLTLLEIRRDGAVFQYRNYRFLVKG